MNDEKRYTEKDMVLAKREACAKEYLIYLRSKVCRNHSDDLSLAIAYAAREYPLPKITRPRVVTIDGLEYRLVDSQLEFRGHSDNWIVSSTDLDRLRAFHDLLARPNEEVEDDGAVL